MAKRKLEDLNLLDDFLFGSMVTHPEVGEKFVREILKTIFDKDFGKPFVNALHIHRLCGGDNNAAHAVRDFSAF